MIHKTEKKNYFLFTGVDITEQRFTAHKYKIEKRFSENLFERSKISKALISLEMSFTKVNQALCDMLGYGEFELLQKGPISILHRDYRFQMGDAAKRLLSKESSHVQYEQKLVRKDKTSFWVLTNISMLYIDEEPIQYIYCVQNIEEFKLNSGEEANFRNNKLFEKSFVPIAYKKWIYDESGDPIDYIIIDVNEEYEKLIGIKKEKIVGKFINGTIYKDYKGREKKLKQKIKDYLVAKNNSNQRTKIDGSISLVLDREFDVYIHVLDSKEGIFATILEEKE